MKSRGKEIKMERIKGGNGEKEGQMVEENDSGRKAPNQRRE